MNKQGDGPAAQCDEKQSPGAGSPPSGTTRPPASESLGTQVCQADLFGSSAGHSPLTNI